ATALGVFSPGWDRLVDTVSGFGLDAAKQQDALNAIETFAAAEGKAMQGGPDDQQDRREAMQAAREKLTTALKKDLTEDQPKKVEESFPGRGMGGGRRGQDGAGAGEKPKK